MDTDKAEVDVREEKPISVKPCLKDALLNAESGDGLCNGSLDNDHVLNSFEISNSEISLNYSDDGEKLSTASEPVNDTGVTNKSSASTPRSLFDNFGKIQGLSMEQNSTRTEQKLSSEHSDSITSLKIPISDSESISHDKTKAVNIDPPKINNETTVGVNTPMEKVLSNGIHVNNNLASSDVNNLDNAQTSHIGNTTPKEPEPVKIVKKQKARKSCHSSQSSASGYSSTASNSSANSPTKINIASFAKKTIKVTELESVLGLKASSLNKMDAKTLDMLVLQKAKQHLSSNRDGKPPKIVQKPVSIVPPSKVNDQESDVNKSVKGRDSVSPSTKTKDGSKGSNQLITQFMVKKENTQLSDKSTKSSEVEQKTDPVASISDSSEQQEQSTTISGVSAVITGQLLLNKSKKKKKNYRGRSGGYRLPGEKIKKIKRRSSNDGSVKKQQQGEDQSKLEKQKDLSHEDSQDLGIVKDLYNNYTDGDTSQNDSQCESVGSTCSDESKPQRHRLKRRLSSGQSDTKQEESEGRPRRRLTKEATEKDNIEGCLHAGEELETPSSVSRTRRSNRKRKLTAVIGEDSDSDISTENYNADWSDSDTLELGEQARTNKGPVSSKDNSHQTGDTVGKKRRKVSQDDEQDEDEEILELPDLSPIKPPVKSMDTDISPPKISPRPIVPIGQKQDALKLEDKKPIDSIGIGHEMTAAQSLKFMNTPNGMSYPVTPPETPESTISSIEENKTLPMTERDKESSISPVCFCRLPGTTFKNVKPQVFCQAVDSVDGKVTGCMTKVINSLVLRPSSRIPFMALCESHRQRLKIHQCCPGCGHYCTQGTFYQCKAGTAAPHHYHRHCQVLRDDKYYCPHCGEQSCQIEVRIEISQSKGTAPLKLDKKGNIGSARMGLGSNTRRLSTDSTTSTHSKQSDITLEEPLKNMLSVKTVNNKEIKIKNVPMGINKKELEVLVQHMQCEEKRKKFRASNKNLYLAAKSGDAERVLYLLCEGFDPNTKFEDQHKQSAIHVAASKGYLTIVHLLTQAGATPHTIDEDLRTPLMEASEHGHTSVVKYLLKLAAVPDSRSSDGMTPLHLAAQSGAVESIKHIVQTGTINVNIKDDGGWTPMIWAAEHRHIESVRFLLDVGSDPNLRDNEDNTGLHWAVFSGSTDIAELFLNAGCDIEAANEHGDRPLHIASRQDHYECVVLLIARGADSIARNNRSDTPLDCCFDKTSQVHMALQVNQQLRKVASQIRRPEKLLHRDITCGKEQYPIPIVNEFDDDNYPTDYLYVTDYVETTPMNINRVITSLESCVCQDNCSSMFCKCSRNSVKCWYTKEGLLPEDFNYTDPPLVFECNRTCSCWANCQNRVIQLGINVRLQVFRAPGKGWGVRSLLDIPKGTYVCEYIGEVLSDAEADKKEDDSYLFDLDNRDKPMKSYLTNIDAPCYGGCRKLMYILQNDSNDITSPNVQPLKKLIEIASEEASFQQKHKNIEYCKESDSFCIDARQYGNVSRFINHRCEPNLSPVKVFVNHQDLRFPRICFFANKDIKAYQELGFDYGDKFWIIKYKQFTCTCDSFKCRYSKDTIHKTVEDYYNRLKEAEEADN